MFYGPSIILLFKMLENLKGITLLHFLYYHFKHKLFLSLYKLKNFQFNNYNLSLKTIIITINSLSIAPEFQA